MKSLKPEWLVYEDEDLKAEQQACDRRFQKQALLAAIACAVLAALLTAGQLLSPGLDELLQRSPYAGGAKDIALRLQFALGKDSYRETADIRVQEQELREEDAQLLFDRCRETLPGELAAEYGDGSKVTMDMELPKDWEGVGLSWHSCDPELISDDGRLVLPQADPYVSARFVLTMHAGGWTEESEVLLPLDLSAVDSDLLAERIVSDLSEQLSADSRGESLELPSEYRGVGLRWARPGLRFPVVLLPLLFLLLLAMYFSRYDSMKKDAERRSAAFLASVPDLSLRLVLLLNAGLVVSAALEELIRQTEADPSPLYRKMREIQRHCSASNSSFEAAFGEYAASTGNRDLMRVSAMISENAGRGSELAGKLEAERSRQWYERLHAAKAKAGEAETKLCLPLMILLVVLVIIAAAPALMNM